MQPEIGSPVIAAPERRDIEQAPQYTDFCLPFLCHSVVSQSRLIDRFVTLLAMLLM
ncbi:MAG: hypothetical protein ACTS6J_20810 [Burkholderiales bacterium]